MQCTVIMATQNLKTLAHWTLMKKITLYSFTIAAHKLNGPLLHLTMRFSHHSCTKALYYCTGLLDATFALCYKNICDQED